MATNRRLKAARAQRGLTQLQLAEAVGKRETDISRYETGRALPDTETKRRIADALGRPPFEIFDT